jgi:hypothetical protein
MIVNVRYGNGDGGRSSGGSGILQRNGFGGEMMARGNDGMKRGGILRNNIGNFSLTKARVLLVRSQRWCCKKIK